MGGLLGSGTTDGCELAEPYGVAGAGGTGAGICEESFCAMAAAGMTSQSNPTMVCLHTRVINFFMFDPRK